MSLYKNKLNTRTGQFNLVPSNNVITWKPAVDTESNLPTEGNILNDARMTNDTHHLYVWDGSSWIDQGDIIDLTWAAISGKPSSSVVDIDDAVTKKHSQNTDIALRTDKLTVDVSGNTEILGSFNLPNDQTIKFGGDIFIKRWEANQTIAIGKTAGADKLNCVYVGYGAGENNTGSKVIAIGYQAAYQNTKDNVTAIGYEAAYLNRTDGVGISVFGYRAGKNNTGSYLTGIGNESGTDNTGDNGVFLGYNSGNTNSGDLVIAIGKEAGRVNSGNTGIGVGFQALYQNTGHQITGVGYRAGRQNSGDNCVFIGYEAGYTNTVANQFIVKQNNINATPLIQGDFATGNVTIAGNFTIQDYKKIYLDTAKTVSIEYEPDNFDGYVFRGAPYIVFPNWGQICSFAGDNGEGSWSPYIEFSSSGLQLLLAATETNQYIKLSSNLNVRIAPGLADGSGNNGVTVLELKGAVDAIAAGLSNTYTFGGGSPGDIATMTFTNGILTAVTTLA